MTNNRYKKLLYKIGVIWSGSVDLIGLYCRTIKLYLARKI